MRKHLLNRSQVRDGGCEADEDERGVVSEMVEWPR